MGKREFVLCKILLIFTAYYCGSISGKLIAGYDHYTG